MYFLGVDLGGTNIACAVVSEDGKILSSHSTPTPKGENRVTEITDAIVATCALCINDSKITFEDIASCGIGSPGAIDVESGTVIFSGNLDFLNVPLAKLVKEKMPADFPVLLENDANAAALGEFVAGAGADAGSIVAITLGTGVGGGAVFNGKLFTGFNYAGMEIGHFVIEQDGKYCTCGRHGCFEAYCSATALISSCKDYMMNDKNSIMWTLVDGDIEKVNGKLPFDAMEKGDETAKKVIDEYIKHLGSGVASIINILQPEVLCIGGGVAYQGEVLLAPIRAILDKEEFSRNNPRRTKIVRATLGNDAGIIGAAFLEKFR